MPKVNETKPKVIGIWKGKPIRTDDPDIRDLIDYMTATLKEKQDRIAMLEGKIISAFGELP